MTYHDDSRRFMCQRCPKTFFTASALAKHLNRHQGADDRPFKCGQCKRAFIVNEDLKKHVKASDKKPIFRRPLSYY